MAEFVVAWDLETVPDLHAFADANSLHGMSLEEVRAQLGDSFPKLPFHKIICIGALIAQRAAVGWEVKSFGAPNISGRSEAELIQAFVTRLDELNPRLVTFNGNSFDLPVLRYRSMKNDVSAPVLFRRPYFNRYTEDALDLCDALASFDARSKITLQELSKFFGLPGKPDGMNGSQVEEYFQAGRFEEISSYCASDVANTYRIWLRYELFRGSISRAQFQFSDANASAYLASHSQGQQKALDGNVG